MNISNLVKILREKQGLTLGALSEKTELSTGFLSKLENGGYDNRNISLETIIRLAHGFGERVKDFLDNLRVIESDDLPNLQVYLRDKYKIKDTGDLKTIEDIINRFKNE